MNNYVSLFKFIANNTEENAINFLIDIVVEIRNELAIEYDILNRDEFEDYRSLCDTSIKMLNNKLIEYMDAYEIAIKCTAIHGEQKHNSRIDSSYWFYQHTWALVTINEISIYVDPTSSQFRYLYPDIPDFYISTIAPPWYYPDSKNPVFNNKITRWIDDHIKIPLLYYKRFDGKHPKLGIIEFFQYEIWGGLCDMKRKFLNKKNNK